MYILNDILSWIKDNSRLVLDIVQSGAIIFTLILTYVQLKKTVSSNRAFVSLQITTSHREIWSHMLNNPALARILDENPDLDKQPITPLERYFVILIANHMSAVYDAYLEGLHRIYEADIASFWELPIPREVWEKIKPYQSPKFVAFVEKLIENSYRNSVKKTIK